MDAAGERWCAVGDSAFSYDPLPGLGVQHALDSATRAAPAIKGFLDRYQPMNVYIRWVNEAFQKYVIARQRYYTLDALWPGSPFWRRRLSSPSLRIEFKLIALISAQLFTFGPPTSFRAGT